jgi:hypothetical protein
VSRISYFYGITIKMYYNEMRHLGRPHFHARHGEDEATIDIRTLSIMAGGLPRNAPRLVVEWAERGRSSIGVARLTASELALARAEEPLVPIDAMP